MFIFLSFRSINNFFLMENTELQSTFELIDNIEFEEKVDCENLVLSSEPTDILNMETLDIKEEP